MSQHDQNIANQGYAATRADINAALVALFTNSSGATEPSTTAAYQFWADTTTGLLKQRNAANSAWVVVGPMASTGFNHATYTADGRLTLASGTPVTTADQTAKTTLYYTPYKGNKIALYDGSVWLPYTTAELSIAAPATTNTMYDVWCYLNGGAPTLEVLAWTNDTTRATALAYQDGVLVKSGAATRRYLGTFRTTGTSGQTEDSAAKRYVWNYHHRVDRPMSATDPTDTWTYSTSSFRQANGSAANQLDLVIGVSEDAVEASVAAHVINSTSTPRAVFAGIGLDTTTGNGATLRVQQRATNDRECLVVAHYKGFPGAGRHYLAWLEAGGGSDTQTWYGDAGFSSNIQSGIVGTVRG